MKIKDGEIRISIEDLALNDDIRREIVKHAVFNELLLYAVAQVIVGGDITWKDEDSPWWIGGCGKLPFEEARLEMAKLAEPGTLAALEEMKKIRDRADERMREYQSRAWRAENLVKSYAEGIKAMCRDERDVTAITSIQKQQA